MAVTTEDLNTLLMASGFERGTRLNNKTWNFFAEAVATNGDPMLHSPAAMERAMRVFKPNIVQIRTPVGKYHARNQTQLIDFVDDASRMRYAAAYERYCEQKAKLRENPAAGRLAILVEENKFLNAADYERAPIFAARADDIVKRNKAAVLVCRNRPTIAKIVRLLTGLYGYKRDDISLIWGGDDMLDAKKRLSQAQMLVIADDIANKRPVKKKIKQLFVRQIQETDDDKALLELDLQDLRLGSQNKRQRQEEIDRFQSGKSRICIFTYQAGGVGLSLHHTDTDQFGMPVTLLPRETCLGPTYSAQDFVQGLGRAHRSIFSLSDTYQYIMFFAGTIEVKVMRIVSKKLRCITKVVQQRESWADAILRDGSDEEEGEQQDFLAQPEDPNAADMALEEDPEEDDE